MIIRKIVESVDKDTLFILFGDHGMTVTGDHGGDSRDERDAGLFMISGKSLVGRQSITGVNYLSQIDLVPTLAAITGVAIPFSNLGIIKTEMLTSIGRARYYIDLNVQQVWIY